MPSCLVNYTKLSHCLLHIMTSPITISKAQFSKDLAQLVSVIPPLPDLREKGLLQATRQVFHWTPEQVFTDPEISHEERCIPGPSGDTSLVILRKRESLSAYSSVIYFLHAGGLIMGTRYTFLSAVLQWVKQLDLVVVSAEYRLAPEHPSPAGFEHAYAGLN